MNWASVKRLVIPLLAATLTVASPTRAENTPSDAGATWQNMTRIDSAAALRLIETSHPGAAPELGDAAFLARLKSARDHLAVRIPQVVNFEGYSSVLNGLARDFGDGHIWSRSLITPARRTWAGIVMARRGGRWVVGAHQRAEGEPDLADAELVQCDGIAAETLGRQRLGEFYADPDLEADLSTHAFRLLLDDGNPFVSRPKRCQFRASWSDIDLTLQWRPVAIREIEPIIASAMSPAKAGMGVSSFAGGEWIELGTLGPQAEKVVQQVRARQAILRSAPMVVLDLRGNGGGNSAYADDIAKILVGEKRWAAADFKLPACSGQYWRVSDGNLEALKSFAASLPDERRAAWTNQAVEMEKAKATRQSFSPALPACARSTRPGERPDPKKLPRSAMKGQLILLTDRACFSSCLIAADLFRSIGAVHVGEETDRSTRYMEVREIVLPSGLRTFSTLQKASIGMADFGPYKPLIKYPGAMADSDALKAWVSKLPLR